MVALGLATIGRRRRRMAPGGINFRLLLVSGQREMSVDANRGAGLDIVVLARS